MKFYFSCSLSKKFFKLLYQEGVRNFLVSFGTNAKIFSPILQEYKDLSVIIDSGAFSAWNHGKVIDIKAYVHFAKNLPKDWIKVSLDVIPKTGSTSQEIEKCCDASVENFLFLQKELKEGVLPVFHYGENFKYLRKYLDYTNYVGLSPANDTMEKTKREFLTKCFKFLGTKVKTHGFGYSSFGGLTLFPFYSCDSISPIRWQSLPYTTHSVSDVPVGSTLSVEDFRFLFTVNINIFLRYQEFNTELWRKRGIFCKGE